MIELGWRLAKLKAHQHAGERFTDAEGHVMWRSVAVYEDLAVKHADGVWRVLQFRRWIAVHEHTDSTAKAGSSIGAMQWSEWQDVPICAENAGK